MAVGLFAFERFVKKENRSVPFFGFEYLDRLQFLGGEERDEPVFDTDFEITNHGSAASDLKIVGASREGVRIFSNSSVVAVGDRATLSFTRHPKEGRVIFSIYCRTADGPVTTKWSYEFGTSKIKPA